MSHLFISYSHKDTNLLAQVLELLRVAEFTDDDIWYDDKIEPTKRWRQEIDEALNEAFGVLVIGTEAAMNSMYVTYEWSWAIGNGIPVATLAYIDHEMLHARLQDIEFLDSRTDLPARFIATVKSMKQPSPRQTLLGSQIGDVALPFRVLSKMTLWCYKLACMGELTYGDFRELAIFTFDETSQLYSKKLVEFWLPRAAAFSSKQMRNFEQLIQSLQTFFDMLNNLVFRTQTGILNDDVDRSIDIENYLRDVVNAQFDTLNATTTAYLMFEQYIPQLSNLDIPRNELTSIKLFAPFDELIFPSLNDATASKIRDVLERMENKHPEVNIAR